MASSLDSLLACAGELKEQAEERKKGENALKTQLIEEQNRAASAETRAQELEQGKRDAEDRCSRLMQEIQRGFSSLEELSQAQSRFSAAEEKAKIAENDARCCSSAMK